MPFEARTAATIRDQALANLRARYLALGKDIDIQKGSPAYNEYDALALELESTELGAHEAANRVLLSSQFGADLDESAGDEGTARLPASFARRRVLVRGPASTTTAINGATLGSASGVRFAPIDPDEGDALLSIATDGGGLAELVCVSSAEGVAGNLGVGTRLTWSSAPAGFSPLGEVIAGVGAVEGEEAEGDNALRQRVRALRRHRPGSGNRWEWLRWALSVGGVGDAFMHRCALKPDLATAPPRPTITFARLGCVTLTVVNPSPEAESYVQNADGTLGAGLQPSYSRRPSQALCDRVEGYIDGTNDALGVPVPSAAQRELYPAVIDRGNWGVVRQGIVPIDVVVGVETNVDGDFVPGSTLTVTAAADASHVTLSSTSDIVEGTGLAFYFTALDVDGLPSVIRGAYATAIVPPGGKSGLNLTLVPPLPAVPPNGTVVRVDPGPLGGAKLWRPVVAAVLSHFDALGTGAPATYPDPITGDPVAIGRYARTPDIVEGARDAPIGSRILLSVLAIPGVVDAEVIFPDGQPGRGAAGTLALPRVIRVKRMGGA